MLEEYKRAYLYANKILVPANIRHSTGVAEEQWTASPWGGVLWSKAQVWPGDAPLTRPRSQLIEVARRQDWSGGHCGRKQSSLQCRSEQGHFRHDPKTENRDKIDKGHVKPQSFSPAKGASWRERQPQPGRRPAPCASNGQRPIAEQSRGPCSKHTQTVQPQQKN